MKVIDLLNKIANGEINEDIKIEYQYGLSYEYCTIREFFDRYIVDKENLNQDITLEDTPKEDNILPWGRVAIEEIKKCNKVSDLKIYIKTMVQVQNEIIDKVNGE